MNFRVSEIRRPPQRQDGFETQQELLKRRVVLPRWQFRSGEAIRELLVRHQGLIGFLGTQTLALYVARNAASKVRPGGTLIFMGGTGGRRPAIGMSIASAGTAALPALTANLALEIAPVRVNLIAAGFVDTPLSAELLGDQLEKRRNQLRTTLPIGRVVGPADVAALAVHIMTNTALTGATYDIDGGQQFVAA